MDPVKVKIDEICPKNQYPKLANIERDTTLNLRKNAYELTMGYQTGSDRDSPSIKRVLLRQRSGSEPHSYLKLM